MSMHQPPPPGFGNAPGYGAPPGTPPGAPHGMPPQPQAPAPYHPQAFGTPQQGPYGWGGPGMPPPPPKRNAGKVWGIIGGIAAVLLVGSVASVALSAGGGSHGGSDGPKYKVTVPQALVGGEYKLAKDISQQADAQVPHDGAGAHDIKTVGGQYTSGTKVLVMLGLYGSIDDPDVAVEHTIRGMKNSGSTEVAVAEKEFTPKGGGGPVTCGVDVRRTSGQKITMPFCVWADSSTSVNVVETDAADLAKDPHSVDLQEFADKAATVRTEVKKPLG